MIEIKLTVNPFEDTEKEAANEDAKPCGIRDGHDCDCGGDCGAVSVGVDFLRRPPEEMSAAELYEMLRLLVSDDKWVKNFCFTDGWCFKFHRCDDCVLEILDLLKAAHEREMENAHKSEEMWVDALGAIARDEIAEMQQQIDDLTHECDGLKRRLEELSDAEIMRLHRLLREAVGEAKNITDAARIYVERERKARGWSKEREAVIERLRELDFSNMTFESHIALSKIGYAILGESAPWYPALLTALRDKLIEMISDGAQDD